MQRPAEVTYCRKLLVACLLSFCASVRARCVMPLEISNQSSIVFTGTSVEPLIAPMELNDAPSLSLTGVPSLWLAAECPRTLQQLRTALADAEIRAEELALSPSKLVAEVGPGLATLRITGTALDLTSARLCLEPGAQTLTRLRARAIKGSIAVSSNLVAGAASQPTTLAGSAADSPAIVATTLEGGEIELKVSGFNFTYGSHFTVGHIAGEGRHYLGGTLVLQGNTGILRGGTSAPGPADALFKVPGSASAPRVLHLPVLPDVHAGNIARPSAAVQGPSKASRAPHAIAAISTSGGAMPARSAPAGSSANRPPARAMPGRQSNSIVHHSGPSQSTTGRRLQAALAGDWPLSPIESSLRRLSCLNGEGGTCASCKSGWEGNFCDVCQTDDSCKNALNFQDAVCDKTPLYSRGSRYKSYNCALAGSVLESALSHFALACNTTTLDGKSGGYCQVGLTVASAPDNAGVCVADGCAFEEGSARVQCRDAQCSCQTGACPDEVLAYASLIQGKDVAVDCDAEAKCSIDIQDFPLKLSLPCSFGDCQSASHPALFGQKVQAAPRARSRISSAVCISALPLLLLAGMALIALFSCAASSFSGKGQALDHRSACKEEGPRIVELRFEDIRCCVAGSRLGGLVPSWSGRPAMQASMAVNTRHWKRRRTHAEGRVDSQWDADGLRGSRHDQSTAVKALEVGTIAPRTPLTRCQSSLKENLDSWLMNSDTSAKHVSQHELRPSQEHSTSILHHLKEMLRRPTTLEILHGVSGQACCGEMVGLMGPSGSGKSTLLSILADSTISLSGASRVSGLISINGRPRREATGSSAAAYVPQSDFLLPSLTVEETLWFSCKLRLPSRTRAAAIKGRVGRVMEELGILDIANSRVGGSGGVRGISGGERRRVSIGTEMVTDASLLLLDEPTSGLDSVTATKLLLSLRQIARSNRIVMLSIHQPSPCMFSLLDSCLLLCRGHIVFDGRPDDAETFFLAAGLPCPAEKAVAEHMMDLAADAGLQECLLEFVESNGPSLREAGKPLETWHSSPAGIPSPCPRPGIATEVAALSWRTFADIRRNPSLLLLHIGIAAAMGVGVGVMFHSLPHDISGAQGRLGIVFFTLCLSALTSLTTVDLLTNERCLVVREVQAGYYRAGVYYLCKATLDAIFLRVVPTIIYAAPVYAMAKLQGSVGHAALFVCVATVFSAVIGALSMAITVGFDSAGKASLVMNVVLLVQLLFAGYFTDLDRVTPVLRWLRWLSAFYYGFESLVVNEISGLDFAFEAGPGVSASLAGDAFLDAVHLQKGSLVRDVALLDGLYLAFLVAGCVLLYMNIPRRLRWTNA